MDLRVLTSRPQCRVTAAMKGVPPTTAPPFARWDRATARATAAARASASGDPCVSKDFRYASQLGWKEAMALFNLN